MTAVLLGLTLVAVGWLVIWVGKDHSQPSQTWWPFAMRETKAPKTSESGPNRRRGPGRGGTGGSAERPWRRSGS